MLADLHLSIEPGQRVLVAGPSGAGKSTLLRGMAGLLLANDVGDLSGRVHVDGHPPQEVPGRVGLLLQDPTAAVVAARVGRDVAFGLENTRVPRARMPQRVRQALRAARFPYDEHRRTSALSGGESQRLALAGALVLAPGVLLLDEPTAMLDEENAEAVRRSVLEAVAEQDTTLVVVAHRLEPWLPHVDRLVVLGADGRVVADGAPDTVLASQGGSLAAQGIWVPGLPAPEPLAVEPGLVPVAEARAGLACGEPLITARDLTVRHTAPFGRGGPESTALDGVGCTLPAGRLIAMTGPSGAGKSTLLAVLAGLVRPQRGRAEIGGRELSRMPSAELAAHVAWVPQTPEHGLVSRTALEEMLLTPRVLGRPEARTRERCLALLEVLGLQHLADVSGHRLSGGEQRRLVVAAALAHGPAALLLDEPTVGQDRLTWASVAGVCEAARAAGAAVAVAGHDRDLLARADGPALRLQNGRLDEVAR